MNKEPFISIEGVLYDVKAGVMEVGEALKEITGYMWKKGCKYCQLKAEYFSSEAERHKCTNELGHEL